MSPPALAPTIEQLSKTKAETCRPRRVAERGIANRTPQAVEIAPDEDAGAEAGIETVFRRKLAGLKALRRSERPHALRAAREERLAALKALQDRRARARHAQRLLRRLVKPVPQ